MKRPSIVARLFGGWFFGRSKPIAQRGVQAVAFQGPGRGAPVPVVAGDPPTGSRGWTFPPIHVSSSNVATVAYDLASMTLEVSFNNGSVYHYKGVPVWKYQGLMGAASKGSYLHWHVKVPKGAYPVQRVA